jgi:SAM-dependent methyltransferase
MSRRPVTKDFDDPDVRSLTGPSLAQLWSEEAHELFGPPRDAPHDVALRFNQERVPCVLDVGCGSGSFAQAYAGRWVGLDRSIEQLRETSGERVLADALALPLPDDCFPGVTALYVLYFFEDLPLRAFLPAASIEEAERGAEEIETPMKLTKLRAWAVARKPY